MTFNTTMQTTSRAKKINLGKKNNPSSLSLFLATDIFKASKISLKKTFKIILLSTQHVFGRIVCYPINVQPPINCAFFLSNNQTCLLLLLLLLLTSDETVIFSSSLSSTTDHKSHGTSMRYSCCSNTFFFFYFKTDTGKKNMTLFNLQIHFWIKMHYQKFLQITSSNVNNSQLVDEWLCLLLSLMPQLISVATS